MSYQPSVIIQPQFVATGGAAKLTLTTAIAGTTGTIVPNLMQIYVGVCRFKNVSAAPVTLKVWRAPAGAPTAIDVNVEVPTVTIPVASFNVPYFEWNPSEYLSAGDAIWANASAASAITVSADGALIQ